MVNNLPTKHKMLFKNTLKSASRITPIIKNTIKEQIKEQVKEKFLSQALSQANQFTNLSNLSTHLQSFSKAITSNKALLIRGGGIGGVGLWLLKKTYNKLAKGKIREIFGKGKANEDNPFGKLFEEDEQNSSGSNTSPSSPSSRERPRFPTFPGLPGFLEMPLSILLVITGIFAIFGRRLPPRIQTTVNKTLQKTVDVILPPRKKSMVQWTREHIQTGGDFLFHNPQYIVLLYYTS
jgi:hypothetical protein